MSILFFILISLLITLFPANNTHIKEQPKVSTQIDYSTNIMLKENKKDISKIPNKKTISIKTKIETKNKHQKKTPKRYWTKQVLSKIDKKIKTK